jgi:exonuclease VII large subunit
MVSDRNGRALATVAELGEGERVELHFADGRAAVSIEEIDRGGEP